MLLSISGHSISKHKLLHVFQLRIKNKINIFYEIVYIVASVLRIESKDGRT